MPQKSAVYPGTFDPITNGHIDIIERASKLFDKLIILVGDNPSKKTLFSKDERVEMIKEAVKGNKFREKIEAEYFNGLLLDFVKRKNSNVIIRGLRAVSDFEYEFQRALLNRKIDDSIETVFIMTKDEYAFLSSAIIREIAMFHGPVKDFVPEFVEKKLRGKFDKR